MARFLIVTWDGAGNLVPTLGIARELIARGHSVRVLGHDTIAELCTGLGATFLPYSVKPNWEMENPDDTQEEIELMLGQLCFSPSIAADVSAELDREPADAILVDCMLFSALDVAQASGVPTATLFHTAYTLFRGGPLVEMFAPGIERSNALRAELDLPQITQLGDIHDSCDLALVAVPKEFEPDVQDASNVLRIGPVLDAPPLSSTIDALDVEDGTTPVVLVSLSTSEQGQLPLLERIVDAVATLPVRAIVTTGPSIDPSAIDAGANTQVVRYVPHADVLPATSIVITHAGLGTVMASLGRGVPMVCVPMGRDQFFNAQQVAAMGAGCALPADADAEAIADAARSLLNDASARATAKQAAVTFASYGGADAAVDELESLSMHD